MDRSLFLFEENSLSKKLVVVFSGINAKSFMGYKLLKGTPFNKLFIRDNTKSWYSGDIKGLSKSYEELLEKIKEITDKFETKDITFIGSSMGGYAALLFGKELKVKNIMAFGPQIVINKNLPNNPTNNDYIKNKNLTEFINSSDANIDIFIGLNELADIYHIQAIKEKHNINIYRFFGQEHNVMSFLHSIGVLKEFIVTKIENSSFKIDILSNCVFSYDKGMLSKAIENYYIKKEYQYALDCFEKLIEQNRSLNTLWKFKGLCLYHLKKYNEAMSGFKVAEQMIYNDEQLHFYMGLTYQKLNKHELSLIHFKSALKISDGIKLKHYIKLAISYRELSMYDEALNILNKSLLVSSKNFGTYYQFGMIYQKKNQLEKALFCYKKALDLNPENEKTIEKVKELS